MKDNAVMALLHDKLFRQRVEKKRKGKGSYQRKAKYASNWFEKPDDKVLISEILSSGFSFQFQYKNNKQRKSICQSKQKFYLTILGMSISDPGEEGAQSHFLKPFISRSRLILKAKMCIMNLCTK